MICPNCEKQIADGAAFCKYCGKPTASNDIKKCKFCGASITESGVLFCSECGRKQTEQTADFAPPVFEPIAKEPETRREEPEKQEPFATPVFEPMTKEHETRREEPEKQEPFAPPVFGTPQTVAERPQERLSDSNGYCEKHNNKEAEAGARCKECGAELSCGEEFCSSCGSPVSVNKKRGKVFIAAVICAAALLLFTAAGLILFDIIPLPTLKNAGVPASEPTEEAAEGSAEKTAEPDINTQPTQTAAGPAEEQQPLTESPADTSEPLPEAPAATPAPTVAEAGEALAEEGIYVIYSSGDPQRVINLSGKTDTSTDKDGTKAILWDPTGSNMQKFRLSESGSEAGKARLFAMSSSDGAGRVLLATDISEGAGIVLGTPDGEDSDELWRIYSREDGAGVIELAEDPSLVIGVDTKQGTYGRLVLKKKDDNDPYQAWTFNTADASPETAEKLLLPNGEEDPEAFILELDDRSISYDELLGFSQTQTAYIRNGIFALSGDIFSKQEYRDYFGSKPWYTPMYEDSDTVVTLFNKYQRANLEIIVQYERDKGWRK